MNLRWWSRPHRTPTRWQHVMYDGNWYPTPALDLALWYAWPEIIRRFNDPDPVLIPLDEFIAALADEGFIETNRRADAYLEELRQEGRHHP